MKRRFLLLGILSLLCISRLTAQSSLIDSVITETSVRQLVEYLSADSLAGRLTNTPGQEKAAAFIAAEFKKAGLLTVAGQEGYYMPFSYSWMGEAGQSKNVVGVLPGKSKPNELVLISAHYDHIGTSSTNPVNFLSERGKPEKSDTVYNGANDNGSGTSALISMARYFGSLKNNERTIIFIAFAGEELGLMGSRDMTRTMDMQYIKAMINMDMIGVPISKRRRNPFITGATLSDLQLIMNEQLYSINPKLYGKQYFKADPFLSDHLFKRSDNYWFALRGIAAHTILATHPHNRYYHSLNDEVSTIDFPLLTSITKAIALSITGIINGTQTPSKLDIESMSNF